MAGPEGADEREGDEPRFDGAGWDDPLERLERNERSTRQALVYVLCATGAVLLLGLVLGLALDLDARPCPGHGRLCTSAPRLTVVLAPTALSLCLAAYAMWQTYRRWRELVRWRPWLFACQVMWLVTTGYMLVSASFAFVGS